uniref:Transposase n=1 Tax=Macrostomum lignano TaxID=282301 RepID=A0A1I8FB60_9PLAT
MCLMDCGQFAIKSAATGQGHLRQRVVTLIDAFTPEFAVCSEFTDVYLSRLTWASISPNGCRAATSAQITFAFWLSDTAADSSILHSANIIAQANTVQRNAANRPLRAGMDADANGHCCSGLLDPRPGLSDHGRGRLCRHPYLARYARSGGRSRMAFVC